MGNYISCKEKRILRRMQKMSDFYFMHMEIIVNFEVVKLG